ncbi:ribosome small subunit-dependent GTPase A [Dehalobacterium formicoaceticum]|uniref:Small ribosomal subunit biogenesis GTPase RsgA n=1 Tax=Dehalobacterium formicoaceticum TaxID=51515 RepID=A0ABT1Y3B7_9FIRM|nr:ribosome small subunit-dependent GTPase A [Dehalobacterium formicoaceticum]MCR6544645.1 ribosome small subunit-dependent GTPase A [Dehalobacterium formicoaceticum]
MEEGILIKFYGGFYYVKAGDQLWECSLRGRFRNQKQNILAGDRVLITFRDEKTGVIEKILPRTSELNRPSVANVEQVLIVFALKNPDPDFLLLDRLLLISRQKNLPAAVIFNKADLATNDAATEILQTYQKADYESILCSTKTGLGLADVGAVLKDKISVFTGPSGAGKSSLLNAVSSGLALKTGEVSQKIGRGKHTTRHVELLPLDFGGWVADTPGFSVLETPSISREELDDFFPEIGAYRGGCRFTSCVHHKEPDCAVKDAVAAGTIDPGRYQRYLHFLQEVTEQERRY